MSRSIFGIDQPRRDIDVPIAEWTFKRIHPFGDPGFSGINLLAPTDETNNYRPISVAIETRNQELGLWVIKVRSVLLSRHEIRCLFYVPGALGFIKQSYMFYRRLRIDKAFITKMMNILYERLHLTHCFALPYFAPLLFVVPYSVSRQGLVQDSHERTITRKENAIKVVGLVSTLSSYVQPD